MKDSKKQSFISRSLYFIDILGKPVGLSYNSQPTIKTGIGGFLTSFIYIFTIYFIIILSQELIKKEKPISRFTKSFDKNLDLHLNFEDIPFFFQFYTRINEIPNLISNPLSKIKIQIRYYRLSVNLETHSVESKLNILSVEVCNPDIHFGKYKDFITDPSNQIPYNFMYCINNREEYDENENLIGSFDEKIQILNEFGSVPGNYIGAVFYPCKNDTSKYTCAPQEEVDKTLDEIILNFLVPDYYINVDDKESPNKLYLKNFANIISNRAKKINFYTFKSTYINTDVGFLREESLENQFHQLDAIRTEQYASQYVDDFYVAILDRSKIQDHYFRKYIKIQDIVANVGGLFNSFILIAKIFCFIYSEQKFLISISNNIFFKHSSPTAPEFYKKINSENSGNNLIFIYPMNKNNKIEQLNYNAKKLNPIIKELNLSLKDYIISKICKKKSKYINSEYKLMMNFCQEHLDICYLIKKLIKIEKFMSLFLTEKDCKVLNMKLNIEGLSNYKLNKHFDIYNDNDAKEFYKTFRGKISFNNLNNLNDDRIENILMNEKV